VAPEQDAPPEPSRADQIKREREEWRKRRKSWNVEREL
jgi:hypothetical protein